MRCGYHGLKFDPSGRCIEIPGLERVPEQARVRTYPLAVRNKWIFVWMGDPLKADVALLPDNFSCDHPEWKNKPGYLHYDTATAICDNLRDFSHLSYVHEKTSAEPCDRAGARADRAATARNSGYPSRP